MASTSGAPPRSRGGIPFGKFLLGLLAGLALTLAFGGGALLAYQGQYEDRIHPGVTVDGVDVSGLTREAAAAHLRARLAGYGEGEAVVRIDGAAIRVPYAALGRRADVDALVERAWSIGRGDPDLVRGTVQDVRNLLDGVHVGALVVVDPAAVRREVAAVAARVDRAPADGSATVTETGFEAQPAAFGSALRQDEVVAALLGILADPAAPATVDVAGTSDPVPPGIDDADVAEAIAAAERMATDVTVKAGRQTGTIRAATVRGWIGFARAAEGYTPTLAESAPTKALKGLAKKLNTAPRNAGFRFQGSAITGVVAGRDGSAIDVAASAPIVAAAIVERGTSTAAPGPVELAMKAVEPSLTTAEAQKASTRMRKVSQWTTYYESSERNGYSNNISIPARDLDGTVVAPGEVFEFWSRIGPVTAARGYRAGGAIINGRSEPTGAFAGGICSTSTTLFNAVARAGYQMLARQNHYYYISRYPTGLDATVAISGGAVTTMSWKNDSDYPVVIRSSARPGVVSFSIYTVAVNRRPAVVGGSAVPGATNRTYQVANGRTVRFSTSPKRNYQNAGSSTVRTTSLPPGRVKVVEVPTDGFDVTVTRQVWQGGELIRRNVWVSNYARVDGLTLVGAR
jgi:vancomycin resistance protein YoaR